MRQTERKRSSTRTAASAVLGLACVVVVMFTPAPALGQPLATGLASLDIDSLSSSEQHLAATRARQTGAGMIRVVIYWNSVAPASEPANWNPGNPADSNYNWASFDDQIEALHDAGLEPLVAIYGAPNWACRGDGISNCDPDPNRYAQFARAAAQRYSGAFQSLPRVRYWQAWIEPNLSSFYQPGSTIAPGHYRTLLNQFAHVVRSVHKSNLIIFAGLVPLKRPGGPAPLDFMRRLLCMKGRAHPKPSCKATTSLDIWTANPYTTGGPTRDAVGVDDVSLGDLPEMAALLRAATRAGHIDSASRHVPFWVAEFSWDSKPPDPGGLPIGILRRWTSEAMYRAWKVGVSRFFWLSLRDWDRHGLPYHETIQSGLYFRGATLAKDRPKANLQAFRFPFVAFRRQHGVLVWGRTPTSTRGTVSLSYRIGGSKHRLRSLHANGSGIFTGLIRTRLGSKHRGSVIARFKSSSSVPFSLRGVRDFYQPPFG